VHGTGDSMIPHQLSEKVASLCKNSKLVIIENGEHGFIDSEKSLKTAIDATINFVKALKF
jgi:pimeloyl-ACP methyl ester carboxylesterase